MRASLLALASASFAFAVAFNYFGAWPLTVGGLVVGALLCYLAGGSAGIGAERHLFDARREAAEARAEIRQLRKLLARYGGYGENQN